MAALEGKNQNCSQLLSTLAKSASLQSLSVPFKDNTSEKLDVFEHNWIDAKHLEEEIEALKWIARRKEMEWDCTRQIILQKKLDIKVVKRKINMVKTLNDLGPQVNVDSDDEDTPFEDDDDSSSDEMDSQSHDESMNDTDSSEALHGVAHSSLLGNRYSIDDISPALLPRTSTLLARTVSSYSISTNFQEDKNDDSKSHYDKRNTSEGDALCLMCKEKPPLFVCGTCKNQSYCSEVCQKLHWPHHESDCKEDSSTAILEEIERDLLEDEPTIDKKSAKFKVPISSTEMEISISSSQIATQVDVLRKKRDQKEVDNETGTSSTEFFEKPDKKNTTKCLGCHEKDPKYLCATCNNAWYCCLVCQEKHWDFHQSECES